MDSTLYLIVSGLGLAFLGLMCATMVARSSGLRLSRATVLRSTLLITSTWPVTNALIRAAPSPIATSSAPAKCARPGFQ